MQSMFSKLASMGVLALGLAIIPATLPASAQSNNPSSSGKQAATTPAPNQNGNAANSANNDQNGNAVNPNNNPNQAAAPPAATSTGNNTGTGGDGAWGLWGLVGLLGLFGLARGRGSRTRVEGRDIENRDINDRRVA
jgi:hypothetical protein